MSEFAQQVARGERYQFGRNWARFLRLLTPERIARAEQSLREMLQVESLAALSFLDVGSGSGLFSLAARRLGARVSSFDFDPHSVACTRELKRRYFPDDDQWTVAEGSALDTAFVKGLGQFDLVYAWGVLHHTGNLQLALDNVIHPVKPGGRLFLAIYNQQGWRSRLWTWIKRTYCASWPGRIAVSAAYITYSLIKNFVRDVARGRSPLTFYREHRAQRGMSPVIDWFDWLGGYPFEPATPGEIFDVYRRAGFTLVGLRTTYTLGNNEFVFRRD
jgi:2-polyprenyl-6-hydroxyphenyl methylase/3-demethylubiquinone-9 3-methyltransferase